MHCTYRFHYMHCYFKMKIVYGTLLGTLLEHFLKENYFQQIYGNAYQLELQTK